MTTNKPQNISDQETSSIHSLIIKKIKESRENILLQASWLWGVYPKTRLLSGHKYPFEISNGRHQADT